MISKNRIRHAMTRCLCACAALAAMPALADQVGPAVESDLNGDGLLERFALFDTGTGSVDLQIENTGGRSVLAERVAWKGGIGQEPELSLAPNGSVRLASMNAAIGRNRWEQVLTIAYRQGAYRVAGFTYSWYDTLNLEDNGVCDLNLLSGRGVLTVNEVARDVRTDQAAIPVSAWTEDTGAPEACGF